MNTRVRWIMAGAAALLAFRAVRAYQDRVACGIEAAMTPVDAQPAHGPAAPWNSRSSGD